jgi:dipeptidyl aminopeptidase/acylaminoacyl peptidase
MVRLRLLIPAVAVLLFACARPEETPLIPLTSFFDNPEIAGAQISPDGQWLSYLKPYQGKLNIYVKRFGSDEERRMTTDTIRPVLGYFWAVDASKLLYVQDKGGNEQFHIYAVPLAGEGTPEARDLTPYEGVRAIIFDVPRELPDRILVGLNQRNPSLFDAYWLDLATGALTLVAENPGRFGGLLPDKDNKVRVAVAQGPLGETEIHFRETEQSPWRLVASYPAAESVDPLRVHPDGRRLYMSSNHGDTDLQQLVLLDLYSGQTEALESDPEGQVDLGEAVFSELSDSLIATAYVGDTVRIYPKDAETARDIENLRKLHDGTPNINSMTLDERKMIVSYDSPTDPGATYRYDRDSGQAEFLFRPRPWLDPAQLTGMQPVSFASRDGLTIHGYLTLPKGAEARNLPMVLLVHGGPWARDVWGYDPEAQLFANRGYAVLQVNYRGSTGYGKAFYNAAVKQFARAMHDDLIDGVKWAIDQGIADPQKIAIYGGSYGGYATLVGVTFTPEYFACGVDYVGPSSLITLIESFPPYWRPFMEGSWFRHVGDPTKPEDREDLRSRSPLFFVDRIEDPLFIAQGANDPRVTKVESDQMAIALRDRGVKVDYLVAANEGHGFANADNRLALYRSMERFLGDCLGGRVQDSVAPEIEARIQAMKVNVDTLRLAEPAGNQ